MKKILLFPGAFQLVENYGGYEGLDIWLKSSAQEKIPRADYYIGHSSGAHFILSHHEAVKGGKFIFVNPSIPQRGPLAVLLIWVRFLIGEGVKKKKIVPIHDWWYDVKMILGFLKIDIWKVMQEIPKDDLVIVRGKRDHYFCDERSAEIVKKSGIQLIEVDAGHDWDEHIAQAVRSRILWR
jgi:hypothetical protein